jgi:very-short-patch-repair endonuclease
MDFRLELWVKDVINKFTPELNIVKEFKFMEGRKWRFDIAIPEIKLAIEYEGQGGRHNRFIGYSNDCEKYNYAQYQGWAVLRFTAYHFNKLNISHTLDFIQYVICNRAINKNIEDEAWSKI